LALAEQWTASGDQVVGTTTRPDRLDDVAAVCTRAQLIDGGDWTPIAAIAGNADAVFLAARPRLRSCLTRAQRARQYRSTVLGAALAARSANRRVLFLSSTVVYGDGGPGGSQPIDERVAPTADLEPAAQTFAAAERIVLETPQGTVLRVPDVYGHRLDLEYPAWLELAHELTSGVLPLTGQALCYRVDYRDVASAVALVLAKDLHGVYNVVPDSRRPRMVAEVFDGLADAAGRPRPTYSGEIKTPVRPISSTKLRNTGYDFASSVPA
jgi:nucleoside-diphosphate-sugar epimerase